jgi:hypothetical protein
VDPRQFDNVIRDLGTLPSRRGILAALAGGLLMAAGLEPAGAERGKHRGQRRKHRDRDAHGHVAAQKGGKNGGKGKKNKNKKKSPPRPSRCQGHSDCPSGTLCCRGTCQIPGPGTCCATNDHCGYSLGSCLVCDGGRCVPAPDGRECRGCKRCKGGACAEPNPDALCGGVCCPEHQVCTGIFLKKCCPVAKACGNDCCETDETCDPGTRECCKSCGSVCCDPDTHVCRNPQTDDCCPRCENERCCGNGQQCVDTGPLGLRFCCDKPCGKRPDGTFKDCCDPGETCRDGLCKPNDGCPPGLRTEGGLCCPDGPACGNTCCGAGEVCCDGACRVETTGVCTDEGWCDFDHACEGTQFSSCCQPGEFCCGYTVGFEFIAVCCPRGPGLPCAGPGWCCPPGWEWDGNRGVCCPWEDGQCKAPVPRVRGRGYTGP